jgi:membrane associated rhomboid family serine protease
VLSLIPISDDVPTQRTPVVTLAIIAANILVFFREPGFGTSPSSAAYFFEHAPAPCQLHDACPAGVRLGLGHAVQIPHRSFTSFILAILFSMFLHAGFLHIAGNMLFLWVFGNNVEDHLGPVKFLLFYLAGGVVASLAHVLTHSTSFIPTVGASGAIAAIMGAYILLFPRARVRVLLPIFIFFTMVRMSAFAVLALWFAYQFLIGLPEIAGRIGIGTSGSTEVAWMAHVGGFLFGVVAMYLLGGRPQKAPLQWGGIGGGWR